MSGGQGEEILLAPTLTGAGSEGGHSVWCLSKQSHPLFSVPLPLGVLSPPPDPDSSAELLGCVEPLSCASIPPSADEQA